jgi:hypothetical protein
MANLARGEANKIHRAFFFGEGYTRVTTAILRLYKDDDGPDIDGVGGTAIGAGHVEKTINMNGTTFGVSGLTATTLITITGDNNGTDTVTATNYAIFRPDGTSMMFRGTLVAPIEIEDGTPYEIAIGGLDITLSGAWTTAWGNDVLDHILTGASITWPSDDVELDLTSDEPTASAAGTQLTGTGYAPISLALTSGVWSVTDNVATLATGNTPSYGTVAADWDDPAGANLYDDVGGVRYYFAVLAAITLNTGNTFAFDSDTDNTITVELN